MGPSSASASAKPAGRRDGTLGRSLRQRLPALASARHQRAVTNAFHDCPCFVDVKLSDSMDSTDSYLKTEIFALPLLEGESIATAAMSERRHVLGLAVRSRPVSAGRPRVLRPVNLILVGKRRGNRVIRRQECTPMATRTRTY